VVPAAIRTHLDHITGAPPFRGGQRDRLPHVEGPSIVTFHAVGVHVGQQSKLGALADRAWPGGIAAQIPRRADQLGMCVTDVEPGQQALAELAKERPLGQRVIHHPEVPGAHDRDPLSHRRPLYSWGRVAPPRSRLLPLL